METSSAIENKKSRGRPKSDDPKGRGNPVLVRCQEPFLNEVDDWRARQRPIPTRPEAIRQLAEIGLKKR